MAAAFCPPCATVFSNCRLARWTAPTGMRVSTEIARTLRPAASSGATFARLVSCLSRARGDADGAVSVFMNDLYRKTRRVPERKTLASGLPVI
jgi:hypothetical protein